MPHPAATSLSLRTTLGVHLRPLGSAIGFTTAVLRLACPTPYGFRTASLPRRLWRTPDDIEWHRESGALARRRSRLRVPTEDAAGSSGNSSDAHSPAVNRASAKLTAINANGSTATYVVLASVR